MSWDIDEMLEFLSEWRSAAQIGEKFGLSQGQYNRACNWLLKTNLIVVCKGYYEGCDPKEVSGKIYYYRKK